MHCSRTAAFSTLANCYIHTSTHTRSIQHYTGVDNAS